MKQTGRSGLLFVAFLLCGAALPAAPCAPGATNLCLSAQRFSVSVQWKDFQGRIGQGQAVALTADTGYFWFFNDANIELVVKVLDARAINQKFWVFFGALSNVEYTLTVTDTATGAIRNYLNPSGQFASVGDTSAFSGAAASHAGSETVIAKGTASPPNSIAAIQRAIERSTPAPAAFTPCAGPADALSLSSCRFSVTVDWTDPQGNSGAGQGVQLSADTGYFWFFSSANVELMVKVLDARAVNGKFWVFFGALSNVEYTIHVVDTVSGALHTYHNPASTFASVGDTEAFRGGYGITVQPDAARSVTGTIGAAAGGALSVTAADGTVFTLTVPASSFLFDQDVTMTPVAATGSFPFAGGLASGVSIEPSGLVLPTGANLSIHTPAPIPRTEETAVAWNGSGEDFFLFPPSATGGDLALLILHFGGYGVARGTDGERTSELGREPVDDADLLSHKLAPLLREGRLAAPAAVLGRPERTADLDPAKVKTALDDQYGMLRGLMQDAEEPKDVIDLITGTEAWEAQVKYYLGPVDTVFPGRESAIQTLFTAMVKRAIARIHDKCRAYAAWIKELPAIVEIADRLAIPVTLDVENTLGCLTFKLRFQSTQTESLSGFTLSHAVLVELTLETRRFPSGVHFTLGEGALNYTNNSATGLPDGCSVVTNTSSGSTLKAIIMWTNLRRGGDLEFNVLYDFGFPSDDIGILCRDQPEVAHFANRWWGIYYSLYAGDRNPSATFLQDGPYPFVQRGWTQTGAPSPWALSGLSGSDEGIRDTTTFALFHAPK